MHHTYTMKVLITGAAGFIGSHTAERLRADGHQVIGLDNFSDYYDPFLKRRNASDLHQRGITVHDFDLREHDLSAYLSDDVDVVIHFAAQPGIAASSTFQQYLSNNVLATQRVLDAIDTLKDKPYFVNIATSSIYGLVATLAEDQAPKPASWYGVTKLAAEQLVLAQVRRDLLRGTSLRLYSVYGPRERPDKLYTRLIDCGINGKAFPLFEGSLEHLRSFTYVSDIVDGIVKALELQEACNGEVFNLGTEQENTTAKGIAVVEQLLGHPIEKQLIPPRAGDQSRTCANIDKARKVLGYNPTTSLEEGIQKQIEWFRSQPY